MKDEVYAWEIAQSVKDNNISNYYPFKCSICNEIYGYYFLDGRVIFDGACGCGGSIFDERETDYEEIANIYNRNKDEDLRKEFLEYFKLEV